MSPKFLTAPKLALLSLIAFYCDGHVPTQVNLQVLSFITSHLVPGLAEDTKTSVTGNLGLNDFKDPLTIASNDGTLWHQFVDALWQLKTLDSLVDFFHSLDTIFYPRPDQAENDATGMPSQRRFTTLTRVSIFGVFVRNCKVEWERLAFQDVDSLWQNFAEFREPTATPSRKRMPAPAEGDNSFDLDDFDAGSGGVIKEILQGTQALSLSPSTATEQQTSTKRKGKLSLEDAERLLQFQIEQMQKIGIRLPSEVRSKLEEALQGVELQTNLAHYAKFLDAWYAGDFATSFENLHTYYDYAMHAKDRSQYQYALLNMSILQADFGCYKEALAAMDEAIAASRDNKDMACLNFSLSWLQHFHDVYGREIDHPNQHRLLGTDAEGLAFLKDKARETKMWSVLATALLDEARLFLIKGHEPRAALVRSLEASELVTCHSISSVETALQLVHSSIYSRLGNNNLFRSYTSLINQVYKTNTPVIDQFRAKCRIAYSHALAGDNGTASRIFDSLAGETHQNLKLHQLLTTYTQLFSLRSAVFSHNISVATPLIAALVSSPGIPGENELRFPAALLAISHHVRSGNLSRAFTDLDALSRTAQRSHTDAYQLIRLLSAKALLFAKAGSPRKGFSLAVRATAAALTARILPALWEAVAALAGVLTALGNCRGAVQLVDSVVYQAAEAEDLELLGLLYSTAAEAWVGLARDADWAAPRGGDEAKKREMEAALRTARAWLERAEECYRKMGDLGGLVDVLGKKAILMKLLGEERKKIAEVEESVEEVKGRMQWP